MELYKKYRPSVLSDMIGQDAAVKSLQQMINKQVVPHTMLFTGPSGCGKTTAARALATGIGCHTHDLKELNCANTRGIEFVRDIQQDMQLSPLAGKNRVWIIDECHQLTNAAQSSFLKMLEDTPSHVYFFLATTDPQKLIPTIKNRSTEVKLSEIKAKDLRSLIIRVCKKEKKRISDDVVDEIISASNGSARKALVILHPVILCDSEEDQLKLIAASESERQGIEIARSLLNMKSNFVDVARLIKQVDEEPETIRRMILGYMANVMLGEGNIKLKQRAYLIVSCFSENFYDTGKAGLVASCWEVYYS